MQQELVIRAQQGDVDAFARLVGSAIDRLHGVAIRILSDSDAADDAVQRALIDAWDHIDGLRDPGRFDAWTYRLVVRAALKEIRRERSERGRVRFVVPSVVDRDLGADLAERDAIERGFRRLSPEQRVVLVLHHYADLPLAEIADILGIPAGTVGSRLHTAAARLRAALDRDETRHVLVEGGAR